jgi:hypothetical protein
METQVAKTEMVHGAVVTTIMLTAALAVLLANKSNSSSLLGHPACSLAWWDLLPFQLFS